MAYIYYEDASGVDVAISFDATTRIRHGASALITEHPVEHGTNISDNMRPDNDRLTLDIIVSNTPVRTGAFSKAVPAPTHMDGSVGNFQVASLFFSRSRRRLPGGPSLTVEGGPPKRVREFAPFAGLAAGAGGAGAFIGAGIAVGGSVEVTPAARPVWAAKDIEPEAAGPDSVDVKVLQFSTPFDRVKAVYDALRLLKDNRIKFTVVTTLRTYEDMGLAVMDVEQSATIGNAFEGTLEIQQIRTVYSETVKVTEPLEIRGQQKKKRGNQQAAAETPAQAEVSRSWLADIVGG